MRLPPSLSFVALVFFTAITETTFIRQTSLNHTFLGIIQDFERIHCVRLPGRISLQACAGAILRLPIDHTTGIFHTDGPDDGFKLPVSRSYGDCNVLVQLRVDGPDLDKGNWLDIGVAASEMNGQCASKVESYRRYGGAWMNIGELNGIRIRLDPVVGVLGDVEGNGTVVDEKS